LRRGWKVETYEVSIYYNIKKSISINTDTLTRYMVSETSGVAGKV